MLGIIETMLREGYTIHLFRHEQGSGFVQIICDLKDEVGRHFQGRAQLTQGAVAAAVKKANKTRVTKRAIEPCSALSIQDWDVVTDLVLRLAGTASVYFDDATEKFVVDVELNVTDHYPALVPTDLREAAMKLDPGNKIEWRTSGYYFFLVRNANGFALESPADFDPEFQFCSGKYELTDTVREALTEVSICIDTWTKTQP